MSRAYKRGYTNTERPSASVVVASIAKRLKRERKYSKFTEIYLSFLGKFCKPPIIGGKNRWFATTQVAISIFYPP